MFIDCSDALCLQQISKEKLVVTSEFLVFHFYASSKIFLTACQSPTNVCYRLIDLKRDSKVIQGV